MSGLRKQMLLNHLQKVQEVLGESSGSESEEQDSLGELPTLNGKPGLGHSALEVDETMPKEEIVNWNKFFTEKKMVNIADRAHNFNYYYSLPKNNNDRSIPIYIFHHGAGSSGLTFANLTKELYARMNEECGCFSFDARGHGETTSTLPVKKIRTIKYDRDAFVNDFKAFISYIYDMYLISYPKEKLSIILVGHSLGGSICTFTLTHIRSDIRKRVLGVAMFDIVEEVAIQALQKVQHFLYSTPNQFPSYKEAVDWHVSNGLSHLQSSAEISIPALFQKVKDGGVVRRTDLRMFSPYWDTWFTGLSHHFVTLATCKLLILAGNDNLDRELIIGQMQGKYQLVVFQDSGHFLQEDAPKKCALTLIDFWKRNDNKNVVIKSNWGLK
ncbi:protein phosphatase methylesterase 1 [Monosporozyma unispora]|nr:Protein phosphatase methylesterase 1 [Kazachstania unispora]